MYDKLRIDEVLKHLEQQAEQRPCVKGIVFRQEDQLKPENEIPVEDMGLNIRLWKRHRETAL